MIPPFSVMLLNSSGVSECIILCGNLKYSRQQTTARHEYGPATNQLQQEYS
jgi:hypothetical protein